MDTSDWRLQGQEHYLKGQTFRFKKYADRTTATDHDHCEFCGAKFSDIPGELTEGYATLDDYRWICSPCFEDFKTDFAFHLSNQKGQ
jgi:hypothetical protein